MSITQLDGIQAYARASGRPVARSSFDDSSSISTAPVSGAGGFGSLINTMVTDAVQATRQSEMVSRQAVTGKADLVDVVQAVNNAEIALESVVAVRDRAIGAFQEIMRMQI